MSAKNSMFNINKTDENISNKLRKKFDRIKIITDGVN